MPRRVNGYNYGFPGIWNVSGPYDFAEKPRAVNQHIGYMLNRTQSMFEWSGLPDTIPARILELYLQINGHCAWYEHEGKLYVFTGGLGGEPDVYYMPTIYTIANPALNLSKNLVIGDDCIVMPDDSLYMGMIPLFSRYATMQTENELSMRLAIINTRLTDLISAKDDRTKSSAEKFLADLETGKQGVIAEQAFLDGLKVQPYGTSGNSNYLTNLIEMEQYIKASWYNEIGLNANYNMKRESINAGESQLNDDALLPLVDDMLRCRQTAAEKINEKFGLDIRVGLASSWQDNIEELEAEQAAINPDPEPEPESEPEPEPEPETGEDENGGDDDVDESENT